MRLRQRNALFILTASAALAGCSSGPLAFSQPKTRSAFDRDPLVMAHLTHSKDDPAYRDTETDIAKLDEPQLQPASSHTKSNKPRLLESGPPGIDAPARSRAPDYQWVRGVVHSTRTDGGGTAWYVDYSRTAKDKFGGRLPLAPSPRLGLLREGDPVQLTGRVVADDPLEPKYQVSDIILLR
jgi:hypothetical protein